MIADMSRDGKWLGNLGGESSFQQTGVLRRRGLAAWRKANGSFWQKLPLGVGLGNDQVWVGSGRDDNG